MGGVQGHRVAGMGDGIGSNSSSSAGGVSSLRSNKNYLVLHLCPRWNLSSQLKHKPLARRACISVRVKRRIRKGDNHDGLGSSGVDVGRVGGGYRRVDEGGWVLRILALINLARPKVWEKE